MIIDSHSHIYDSQFDDDRDLVVQRAKQAGVGHIILPNENLASLPRLIDASHRYGDYVSLAIGLHPEEVRDDYADVLQAMYSLLDDHPWVAVGEIGIDLYWEKNWRRQQMEVLDYQLRWCVERGLPFIMHCRDGLNEIIDVFENFGEPLPAGVFHCDLQAQHRGRPTASDRLGPHTPRDRRPLPRSGTPPWQTQRERLPFRSGKTGGSKARRHAERGAKSDFTQRLRPLRLTS